MKLEFKLKNPAWEIAQAPMIEGDMIAVLIVGLSKGIAQPSYRVSRVGGVWPAEYTRIDWRAGTATPTASCFESHPVPVSVGDVIDFKMMCSDDAQFTSSRVAFYPAKETK